MAEFGKILIALGIVLVVTGVVLLVAGRLPWLGHLPGDIVVRRDDFVFVFPLTTCLVLSAVISLLLYWLGR